MKHNLITFVIGLVLSVYAYAQPYTIYPVPHQQTATAGTARLDKRVCIVAEDGIDEATIQRAEQVVRDHALQPFRSDRVCKGCTNILIGINGFFIFLLTLIHDTFIIIVFRTKLFICL